MSEVRRLIQWGVVLAILTVVAIVFGAFLLYQQAFEAERKALRGTLVTQAALIEAVAAFDRTTSPEWRSDNPDAVARGAQAATLSQIKAAFAASPGLGETGDVVMGRKKDGEMVIFLHQRAGMHDHQSMRVEDLPESGIPAFAQWEHAQDIYSHDINETDINETDIAGEPMRRALAGRSGTVIAQDYLNKTVLAAYQPLESLGWGLVAKKDLAEIRAPFIRSAAIAALVGGVLILIGGLLFGRATHPLINRLRRSEARYVQLLEQASEAVIVLAADDHIQIVNAKAAEIFGVSAEAAIRQSVHDFIPPDLGRFIAQVKADREAGETGRYEHTLRRDDEEVRLRISASPLIGPRGEYEGRMALLTDITPEYRERQAHDRERRLLRTVLDTLPVGVWVLDRQGRFTLHNPASNRIWGVGDWSQLDINKRLESFRGRDLESGRPLVGEDWGAVRALRGEEVEPREIEIAALDGQRRVILQSAAPIRHKGGPVKGAVVVAQDITEQKAMQRLLERNEALLSLILENLPAGVSYADEQGEIVLSNPADSRIWGASRLGQKAREYYQWARWADSGKPVMENEWPVTHARGAPSEPSTDQVFEIENVAGEAHTLNISAVPIVHEGQCWGAVELTQDITAERAVQARMRRLSEAVEAAGEAVLVLDAGGRIEYANPAFVEITGYSVEAARGESLEGLLDAGRQSGGFYQDSWTQLRRGKQVRNVMVHRRRDGKMFHWDKTLSPLMDDSGELLNVVVTASDITLQLDAEEALYRATREDPLTGLANDLGFRKGLADRLERIDWGQRTVALALVDVRGFSHLNEALGREQGDAILRALADRLSDVVREGDLVARLGGDTFAVLFADMAREADLPWVIEKLESATEAPYRIEKGESIVVQHYIGVARAPADAHGADHLLSCAHAALDAAKRDPVSNLRYYAPDYGDRAMRQISLEGALRKALAQDAFELYFQPQIDLATGRLRSMEALLRWDDPELGRISPEEFIPLAEQVGLIRAIDNWVLEHALGMQAEWRRLHQGQGSTWMLAINLSGARMADPALPEQLAALLERTGSAPSDLEIEVTETAAMQDSALERRNLAALRGMGVNLAIDDFGTGYSSMSQLARLPVDVLKIDRSFVADLGIKIDQSFVAALGRDETAINVVRTIISLAHSMNLLVIAEGIETREQLALLTQEGCEFGQGFLLARPMPASEMLKNLGRENWLPANEDR
ncbi:EAL domain-containing protein [Guyparkeria sp. GHLCS8-2]|uniref:EAL domain-containing protein n=1 Tax=Guyparkeria halopsychrophila TaxID=3139421 RepID=UPI0037C6F337